MSCSCCRKYNRSICLDGVLWQKNLTYGQIADKYCNFVLSAYHEAVMIFDGHDSGPSTKDVTHSRRYSTLKFTHDKFY